MSLLSGSSAFLPLHLLVNLPWPVKRRIAEHPLAWRMYAGICRRVGWSSDKLGWHAATNGPYFGIHLQATHTNHLWVPMGTYETSISGWLLQLLTGKKWGCVGKGVWDVGAYRGYVSLLCAKHGKGRILSFETYEQNLQYFRLHLRANPTLAGRIEIMPVA